MLPQDPFNPELLVNEVCDEFEQAFQQSKYTLRLGDFWNALPDQAAAYIHRDFKFAKRLLLELIRLRLSIDQSRGIENSPASVLAELPQELSSLIDVGDLSTQDDSRDKVPSEPQGDSRLDSQDDNQQDRRHSGQSFFASAFRDSRSTWKAGDTLGNYRLLEHLGSGGMGTVWRARQSQPVQREVAIKLIGSGTWNQPMVDRFRRECKAMAVLQHPNIARLFEAATTTHGQPFLVMEIVDGPSLVQFSQQQNLSLRERVELFLPLCLAVQHAHQKGILHRDLKPSNILVANHDGVAQAKIIDLGLAKALHPGAIEPEDHGAWTTRTGQIVGTLDYMSPEQTRLGELDIDTRTDVYSLGCVLYELLSYQRPLQQYQLNSLPMEDAIQLIRNAQPASLSGIDRHLSGELEWIVRGCLEKDRSQRYETAVAIADELTRWLHGEPIRRAPPSRLYAAKKFVQRNRGAVTAVAGFILVLTLALQWALNEQARANTATQDAVIAKQNAEQVLNYVTKAFSRASSLRDGHKTLLVDVIEDSIEQIDVDFPEESEIKADIQYAFGDTLNGLGQYEKALPLLQGCLETRERLLGEHEKTLLAKSALLITLRSSYLNATETRTMEQELVDQHRRAGSENSYEGLMIRLCVAFRQPSIDEVTRLRDQLLKFHSDRPGAYDAIFLAAKHYSYYGDSELMEARYIEARQQLEEKLGPAHRCSLRTATGHFHCLAERNRFREAAEIAKATLEHAVESLSERDQMTLDLGSSLGSVLDSGGDYENALIALASAKARCELVQLPDENYLWLTLEHTIGQSQLGSYRLIEAIPKLAHSEAVLHSRVGTDNLTDVERKHYLLDAYLLAGQQDEASALLTEILIMLQRPEWDASKIKGLRPVLRLKVLAMQAYLQSLNGDLDAAILQLEILRQDAIALGAMGVRTVRRIRHYLGMALTEAKRYDEAIAEFDAAIQVSRELDIAPWIRLNLQREKAWTFFSAGHGDSAYELLQQTISEYAELVTADANIEEHPQYRLAILCREIFQDLDMETAGPSEKTLAEIDKVARFIGPNSPLLTSKLAAYRLRTYP